MTKYRILQRKYADGTVVYVVQWKFLFLWITDTLFNYKWQAQLYVNDATHTEKRNILVEEKVVE